jgi:hypothetical protein
MSVCQLTGAGEVPFNSGCIGRSMLQMTIPQSKFSGHQGAPQNSHHPDNFGTLLDEPNVESISNAQLSGQSKVSARAHAPNLGVDAQDTVHQATGMCDGCRTAAKRVKRNEAIDLLNDDDDESSSPGSAGTRNPHPSGVTRSHIHVPASETQTRSIFCRGHGHNIRESHRFCRVCGEQQLFDDDESENTATVFCTGCGHKIREVDCFCRYCGEQQPI